MRLKTEEIITAGKILFVCKKKDSFIEAFEKKLLTYDFEIFTTSHISPSVKRFTYIFVFNDIASLNTLLSKPPLEKTKILLVLYRQKSSLVRIRKTLTNHPAYLIKAININPDQTEPEHIENMLWFLFSKSVEKTLDLELTAPPKKKTPARHINNTFRVPKKKLFFLFVFLFFLFQFFFIAPYTAASFFLISAARSLKMGDVISAQRQVNIAEPLVETANQSYTLARPLFSFFYAALFFDDTLLFENKSLTLLQKGIRATQNGKEIIAHIANQNKTPQEQQRVINRIALVKKDLADMTDIAYVLYDKLTQFPIKPSQRIITQLETFKKMLSQTQKASTHIDTLIGGTHEKKYLILFANNMELRPGGGFIGSYGVVTFQNYTLKDIAVHDVYEADGQLIAHIEPPYPIKTYLNQPHWFLRDSNFSPDFEKNFIQATYFLEKEVGLKDFNGGALITTTAIADLIDNVGGLYMPDYKETITKDNFYIKTQRTAESDFFAGSQQKKNFLSDMVAALQFKISSVPLTTITDTFKHSLDQKDIVLYATDASTQKTIDELGYGGKLAIPECATRQPDGVDNCIAETVMPIDANLGVNKANFFIKRFMTFSIKINDDGTISHTFKTKLRNDASGNTFPGGTYKNYYQLYIPVATTVTGVTIDGQKITNYEESSGGESFKTIGLFVEVTPQQTREIAVSYTLKTPLTVGTTLFQLIVQKQTGAQNSDLVLQLSHPHNMSLVGNNFSGLANGDGIVYNTTLSNDRIFLIQLDKE